MRLLGRALLMIISIMAIGACQQDPLKKIQALEEDLADANFTIDEKGMQTGTALVQAYLAFADSHKEHPKTPEMLYKAADISLNINQPRQALELYNRIIYQYPAFEKAPECLFLMAYINENYFQELGKAKAIYEDFIARYPNHDFTDDAKVSIENLGKSPEELIRIFEEKNRNMADTLNS